MSCSVWHLICFWVFLMVSVRSITGKNDPFQGNFPTLKCLKARLITGCSGTLVGAYEQSNYSKSDTNINRADTFAYLFTRRNKICPEFLHRCGGRLPSNTNFRPEKRTIIIVGGYISGVCDLAFFREFKDQLLFRDDYNIILIDWPWGFYPDIYSSYQNGKVVGKQIAFLCTLIMEQTGINGSSFYIIGHSVGAHIGGHAGRYLKLFTGNQTIGRITGLDPAGAAYSIAGLDDILDKSDADRVDIISTNGGNCFPKTIGFRRPTGHANFYVNGGKYQESCFKSNVIDSFMKGDYLRAFASIFPPLCSHFQATEYYKVSINPCRCEFIGLKCDSNVLETEKWESCGKNGTSKAVMGLDWEYCLDNSASDDGGIFYVRTTHDCPYCDVQFYQSQGIQCDGLNDNICFIPNQNPSREICTNEM